MNDHEYAEFGKGRFDTVSRSKLARILQDAGSSILDVGCGPGAYMQALADSGHIVTGADVNSIFVKQARQITRDVKEINFDSDRLRPFENTSFDTVLMLDILEHIEYDRELLQDARRVCRQNAILTVPARMPQSMQGSQLVFGAYMDPTHKRYYSFEDLNALLGKCGYSRHNIVPALRFEPITYTVFPSYLRYPLYLLNRALLKVSDPRLFTTVWYAVAYK